MTEKLLFVGDDPSLSNTIQRSFHNKNNCETYIAENDNQGLKIISEEGLLL